MSRSQFIVPLDNQILHKELAVVGVGVVKYVVGAIRSTSIGIYLSLGCFYSHGTLVFLGRSVYKYMNALYKFVTLVMRCSPK